MITRYTPRPRRIVTSIQHADKRIQAGVERWVERKSRNTFNPTSNHLIFRMLKRGPRTFEFTPLHPPSSPTRHRFKGIIWYNMHSMASRTSFYCLVPLDSHPHEISKYICPNAVASQPILPSKHVRYSIPPNAVPQPHHMRAV